jgi:hypothetical protein
MNTRFSVITIIKGNLKKEVISRQVSSSGCGAEYKVGMIYLIRGGFNKTDGTIYSDSCGSWTYQKNAGIIPFKKKKFNRLIKEFQKRAN